MQLNGVLDMLSFVRLSRLNWIGHVNRMDSERRVSQVFYNNPQGGRPRGRPNTGGGFVFLYSTCAVFINNYCIIISNSSNIGRMKQKNMNMSQY
jgi:hypothetical protein